MKSKENIKENEAQTVAKDSKNTSATSSCAVKKHKKVWWWVGALVAVTVMVVAVLVLVVFRNNQEEAELTQEATIGIAEAYENGEISADKYVNLTLTALYDTEELPEEYKTGAAEMGRGAELIEFAVEHLDELDSETIELLLYIYGFEGLEFGTDASKNVSTERKFDWFSNGSAYAYSDYGFKKTTLNRARVSAGGRFVIFYTDTGDDAFSDENADNVLVAAEKIIGNYKTQLGMDYGYNRVSNEAFKEETLAQVLAANNVDADIMNTAMPIYVINPYRKQGQLVAEYFSPKYNEMLASLKSAYSSFEVTPMNSSGLKYDFLQHLPSYPFINVMPSVDDSANLEIAMAHELGHHYTLERSKSKYGNYDWNEGFLDETLANYMAVKVSPGVSTSNLVNVQHYNQGYLGKKFAGTKQKLSEVVSGAKGYPTFTFLLNYEEYVPNALEIMLDAAYYGDALKYLYEKAGETNFRKTIMSLAEKNVTGDYPAELPISNMVEPAMEEAPCAALCVKKYAIQPTADNYLEFLVSDYDGRTLTISGGEHIGVSVIGVKQGDQYAVIRRFDNANELSYRVSREDGYERIILAVANWGIDKKEEYSVKVVPEELEEIAGVSEASAMKNSCTESDMDYLIDGMDELAKLMEGLAFLTGDSSRYDTVSEFRNKLAEMDAKGPGAYVVSLCEIEVDSDLSWDELKTRVERLAGPGATSAEIDYWWLSMVLYMNSDPEHGRWGIYGMAETLTQDLSVVMLTIGERER